MIIKKITIENFRSIQRVELDLENFNIQVGQNNHGKTNYFEAIRWFFNGFVTKESKDNILRKTSTDEVSVEVTFTGLQDAISNMSNATKKKGLEKLFSNGEDDVIIRRSTGYEGGKKRELLKPDGAWHDPIGPDGTWGELLPKLEYVDTQVRVNEINGYTKKSPIAEMLSGILGAIIKEDPKYRAFTDKFEELFGDDESQVKAELDALGSKIKVYLQKQFPDGTSVEFAIENPVFEDLLKNFSTKIDDGVKTNIEEKGDGMQRALMLSIVQAYADYRRENSISRKFIFLIDEAELHLHPTAQRSLKKALHEISEHGEQVLINTHSSVLISDKDDSNVYRVIKRDSITTIEPVDEKSKPYVVYDLLGGSPSDILLPKNFMIVEGASECKFIQRIIERFYENSLSDIFILAAEGDINQQNKSMDAINKVLLPIRPIYKEKLVLLCDDPNSQQESDFSNFVSSYSLTEGEDYFKIGANSLEEYYPGVWRKTAAEVLIMQQNREKVSYATKVADEITQEEFERDMKIIYDALLKTNNRAFN
jgi:putative ATP-dependent endonuclease of the OLD family